ncbi:MAG: SusC/RagA family TonB-linked outer membrane protein [Ferruginibacter sp.]
MKKTIEKIPKFLPVFMLFVLISFSSLAQNKITGTVSDSKTGVPTAGVTVTEKGTTTSTQTGSDGTFTISASSASATLVFSSVGFATQEITAASGKPVNVGMVQKGQQLNEVVVVGYGTARKKDLTGAVTLISSKDFQKGSISTPEQLIAGKVAGVSVISNGGGPGSGSTIRIRGGASLNASNDPLIVIDGVPLERGRNNDGSSAISGSPDPLSLINPNDIETFNILKDASAAAIYGSRASNGVIIITTKRGTSGKPRYNFNTNLAISKITRKVDVLDAGRFVEYVKANGTAEQQSLLGIANTDWQDEIYQTAVSNDNNFSVSGTTHKVPYRVSLGYLDQKGILRRGELKRGTVGINISPKFLKNNLKVDINLKGSQTHSLYANEDAIAAAVFFDPTQPVRSGSSRYNGYYEWLDASAANGLRANSPRNPVALLEQDQNEANVKRSIGNAVLEYKFPFFPAMRANLNAGYDYSDGRGTNFINDSAASGYRRFKDAGGIYHGGTNSLYHQQKMNTLFEFYLGYTKDLNSIKSKIDVIAGYSYSKFLTKAYSFDDYTSDKTVAKPQLYYFDEPTVVLLSYYAKLNYSLANRYLLTAIIRRDGTSRFANHPWGNFPALAFAWRIKDEGFLRNSKTFSDLKLRLGYGETAQQEGIGLYDYTSFYFLSTPGAQYQLGNSYYYLNRPSAYYPDRKWETTKTSNIGLDFGLFDGRVTGTVDAYYKKTTDLLNQIDQPAGTNFSNKIVANVGSMENRGIEASLSIDIIRKKNMTWTVGGNFAYNKNKITKLTISDDPNYKGNETGNITIGTGTTLFINTVDFARNQFYVYKQVYGDNGKPIDGLFEDLNRDGKITTDDRYRYKTPDPEAFFGFTTTFTYKKWNLGTVLRAEVGNYMYNQVQAGAATKTNLFGISYLNNVQSDLLRTGISGSKNGYVLSDYYIQNASFLKMDNANIGYNFGAVCHGISNLRFNFNVQNVFVMTKYKGLDPEISSGVDNKFYPRPRTFTFGLNLDF